MKVKYPESIRMYFLLTEMLYLCGYTFLSRYPLKKKKNSHYIGPGFQKFS